MMCLARRGLLLVLLVCLLAVTAPASAGRERVLSFPDQATREAFKAKGQAPGFAEWKAQKDTRKASTRPTYECDQRDSKPNWVLWSRPQDIRDSGKWVLQTAYPSFSSCTQALDTREQDGRKNGWRTERRAPSDLSFMFDASRGALYQCLPDTVDPRGPKGK